MVACARCTAVGAVLCLFTATAFAQPEPVPAQWLQDAELTSVSFIDADRGWAVGDRGVIWHTSDGGRNWKLQNSGVTCRLEAVQFLDADNGVAVGGWTQAYTHETHGVALRTRDGGKTWQNTPDLTLPGLRHVRFFDARQGWAIGDGSALYPGGVFRSEDGGRTWTPVAKGETLGWVTGDFQDPKSGAVAGFGGSLGIVTSTEIRPSRTTNLGPRSLRRLLLTGQTGGWLIGDGGLVLTTRDSGFTWTAPAGELPDVAARELDFRALAVRENHIWIAGAPGTCVVHSGDGGQKWQVSRTEQTAPLRGLAFIDEYRGWAVGSLGTILHTRDGGQTWRVQRAGGARTALLGIVSESARMPLEMVADQGGNSAFLTAVEVIGREAAPADLSQRTAFTASERIQAAVVAAGGSAADSAWRFPLPEAALLQTSDGILARWNAANDGKALERLEEHLVRRIRQWRPDTIVTEDVSPRGENPLAHLTNQVTLAAVNKASDETAYPDQIKEAGLAAWRVKKVFTLLPAEKQGLVNMTPSQWSPRLGRSVAEQAQFGRGLIFTDVQASPRNVGLSLLVDRLPQDSGKRDIMSGIALQAGGEARRQLTDPPAGNLEALSQVAQKRHNVEQLLDRMSSDATVGAGWLGQAADLTKGLSNRTAGEILWQLARKYQQTGKSREAADALHLMLEKYPQHPLADAAALWLVRYYASGEVAWRERKETRYEVRLATAATDVEETASAAAAKQAPAIKAASFASVGATRTAAPDLNPAERAGRALALAKQIEQTRPTLYAEAPLRFAVAAAARQAGQPRMAERFFQLLTTNKSQSIWATNAAAEQWLFRPSETPPKKVCPIVAAVEKPRLDGRLDDIVWKMAKPVSLQNVEGKTDSTTATAAVFTFDDEFLYVAVSCGKAAGVDYAAKAASRASDTDLSARDRVTVLLDIDRDYATYWSLTIDHRGWPAESCFGDSTWNPQWFIATAGDDQYWTAEAAIPLAELCPKKPQVRDVWAIGIERIIPRVGLQAFTTPAAIETRPEGFGLLVFE
ncbi:MAG TPA: YCF48-related protein [Pirellulaceae bacterium]